MQVHPSPIAKSVGDDIMVSRIRGIEILAWVCEGAGWRKHGSCQLSMWWRNSWGSKFRLGSWVGIVLFLGGGNDGQLWRQDFHAQGWWPR